MKLSYIMTAALAFAYSCVMAVSVSATNPATDYPVVTEHNIDISRMMPVRQSCFTVSNEQARNIRKAVASYSVRSDFEVRGSVIASSMWGTSASSRKYGIYSAQSDNAGGFSVTPLALDSKLNATTGAVMTPKGYFVISTTSYMGYYLVDHYLFDPSDWSVISRTASDMESMARALTYNPADAKIYGCFANLDGTYSFSSLDMKSGDRKRITSRMENPYTAMAADNSGTIYAIDSSGDLVTLDSKTGGSTLIAHLSLPSPYTTSAVYDSASGCILYVQAREDASELFAIDPVEGTAEAIGVFPLGLQWGGLYVPDPEAAAEAPAAASDLAASFEGGSLEGEISFTVPETLFNGSPAEGQLRWELLLNSDNWADGLCQPGEIVTVPVKVDAPDLYSFTVRLSNNAGKSPEKTISLAIGPDIPVAVSDVKLSYDAESETAELLWVAPNRGVNDGWLDPDALTYDIIRYPGAVAVAEGVSATNWSEPFAKPEGLLTLRYAVIPSQEGRRGQPSFSNAMAMGDISLPYEVDFHAPDVLDSFFVEDANGDGVTWTPDEKNGAYVDYSSVQMDDWLISAPLEMKKGMVYAVTIDAWSQSVRHDERLALWIGTGMESAKMTKRITSRSYDGHPAPSTTLVTVDEDGIYHLGLQGCSPAGQYILRLGALSIAAPVPQEAPAAPRFLTMEPDARGDLSLTARLMVPMKATDESNLNSLKSFVVKRGDVEVFRVDNPNPGQIVTLYDNPEAAGAYTYSAFAESEVGIGLETEATVFIGVNVPAAPGNITYLDGNPDGELSWSPPVTGADGLQLNTDDITYHVYNKYFEEIGTTKDTAFPVTLSSSASHTSVYYVKAESSAGITPGWRGSSRLINLNPGDGRMGMSIEEMDGNVVHLSYADGEVSGPAEWYVEGDNLNGRTRLCTDLDKTEGSAFIALPPVTIKSLDEESYVRFIYTPEKDATKLSVFVLDNSMTFTLPMADVDFAGGQPREIILSLDGHAERTVNIGIAVSGKGKVSLSDLEVNWRRPVDIRVEELSSPAGHTRGLVPMKASVVNLGKEAVGPFEVVLVGKYSESDDYGHSSSDEDVIAVKSTGCSLRSGESVWVDFEVPFTQFKDEYLYVRAIKPEVEGNQAPDGNAVARVRFEDKKLPVPCNLQAAMSPDEKTVRLSWRAPDGLDKNLQTNGGETLTFYDIYSNEELVASSKPSETEVTCDVVPAEIGEDRTDSYTVVARYGSEESVPSESCLVLVTEVIKISTETIAALRAEASGDEILLYGAQGPVDVYGLSGIKIMHLAAPEQPSDEPLCLRLHPGVYILTDGTTVLRLRL